MDRCVVVMTPITAVDGHAAFAVYSGTPHEIDLNFPLFFALKWTYVCGNNWGECGDGTQGVGCGPQEWFRACSDIRISGEAVDNGDGGYTADTAFPADATQTMKPPRR